MFFAWDLYVWVLGLDVYRMDRTERLDTKSRDQLNLGGRPRGYPIDVVNQACRVDCNDRDGRQRLDKGKSRGFM